MGRAVWQDGDNYVPLTGWRTHVEDERLTVVWTDADWRDRIVGTPNGGAIRLVALEQELTLTGAFVDTTTAVIADRMIVLAVASRKADVSNDIAGRKVVAEARTDIAQMKATLGEFRERIDRLESHEDGRKHA